MLVNRRTHTVKMGRMEEAVKLFKAEIERIDYPNNYRIYTSKFGAFHRLDLELECENEEEYNRLFNQWVSDPETQVFMKKWAELAVSQDTNEIWELR